LPDKDKISLGESIFRTLTSGLEGSQKALGVRMLNDINVEYYLFKGLGGPRVLEILSTSEKKEERLLNDLMAFHIYH
jgi:hypothetical protein